MFISFTVSLSSWKKGAKTTLLARKAKSEVWKSFDHVHNENNEPAGYVKCKICDILLKYVSHDVEKYINDSFLIKCKRAVCGL